MTFDSILQLVQGVKATSMPDLGKNSIIVFLYKEGGNTREWYSLKSVKVFSKILIKRASVCDQNSVSAIHMSREASNIYICEITSAEPSAGRRGKDLSLFRRLCHKFPVFLVWMQA